MRKPKPSPQVDLFGDPIVDSKDRPPKMMLAEFESYTVRMFTIKGDPWWVAADVCRALGLSNPSAAIQGLDDDERMTLSNTEGHSGTRGGAQSYNVVNESGLYNLIFTSRKPEAKRFRKWVTSEVLPSLRKTGSFIQTNSRVVRISRKCKTTDPAVILHRSKQIEINKRTSRRLADEGHGPREIAGYYNTGYVSQFGRPCKMVREAMGLKPWQTPLDRMSDIVLAQSLHAKLLADRLIEDQAKAEGKAVAIDVQQQIMEETAQHVVEADFSRCGFAYAYGVIDHPERGKVLDMIRVQISGDPEPRGIAS